MTLTSINPATGEQLAETRTDSPLGVERKIAAASAAFGPWARSSFSERAALMNRAAANIRADRTRLSELVAMEMGKPIVQSEREVDRFAGRCGYFAEHAEEMLQPERITSPGAESWIRFEPLGVALGVMPWNYPFGQASRWAVPALMAGNPVLLKHASNVALSARAIEAVFTAAGFPAGVFDVLYLSSRQLGPVLADPRIASVSLTGSTAAGESIGREAGAHLKKLVLELGGSDAFVVLEDADIAAAAEAAARSRFMNSGQACTAAKRFIVVAGVAARFTENFVAEVERLTVGNPLDRATEIGPLAKRDVLGEIERQAATSIAAGARIAYQANIDRGTGYYFPPTVLTGVAGEMPVAREETFGPLAPIIEVPDAAAALRVANDSSFGLGASVWGADVTRATALATELMVGMVAINSTVLADPRLPFGGTKRSGFGREMSAYGIKELTNIKVVTVGSPEAPKFSR